MKKIILFSILQLTLSIPLYSQAPVANFTCSVDSVARYYCAFHFTDISTNSPTEWLWDFCDGSTSFSNNPIKEIPFMGECRIKLRASNAFGFDIIYCNVYVDTFACTCCGAPTNINVVKISDNMVRIYPNPFNSNTQINFDYEQGATYSLSLYNSLLQQVMEEKQLDSGQVTISRANLASGIYLFQMRKNSIIIWSQKIIIE